MIGARNHADAYTWNPPGQDPRISLILRLLRGKKARLFADEVWIAVSIEIRGDQDGRRQGIG